MKRKIKSMKSTNSENQGKIPVKIAIIGGGIAGLYTAWRILSDSPEKFDVTLYESDSRLGGRIYSQKIPELPFKAELGAMRFRLSHQILCALLNEFQIPTRKFDVTEPVYYIRGRRLTERELELGRCKSCGAGIPFQLKHNEQNFSPSDLIQDAVIKAIEKLTFVGDDLGQTDASRLADKLSRGKGVVSPEDWEKVKKYGRFGDIPLYNIGFWNLLHHFLSNEAYVMLHDLLSLDSVLGNWNAAEAIPWFLSDFVNNDFQMIPGGTDRVITKLETAIKETAIKMFQKEIISFESKVISIRCNKDKDDNKTGGWLLDIKKGNDIFESGPYDKVILALPRKALENLTIELPEQVLEQRKENREIVYNKDLENLPNWVSWVRPHRMFKLFLVYETPWWIGDNFPGSGDGRVYTDLPLRQVYYFSPKWMRKCLEVAKLEKNNDFLDFEDNELTKNWSLIMASYSDEQHVSFWNPILSDPTLHPVNENDGERIHIHFPANLNNEMRQKLRKKIPDNLLASERMVEKVQRQLEEIHHGKTIPKPILGVFKDWGADPFAGGWHTWEVGTKPWEKSWESKCKECKECNEGKECKNASLKEYSNIYLCGEAYASVQGWIESALKTAESVLAKLEVPKHKWKNGQDIIKLENYIKY
jgi:hypothetical protein